MNPGDGAECGHCKQYLHDDCVWLKNCPHKMHSHCLEEIFEASKNKCTVCEAIISDGYEAAINPKTAASKKKEIKKPNPPSSRRGSSSNRNLT